MYHQPMSGQRQLGFNLSGSKCITYQIRMFDGTAL